MKKILFLNLLMISLIGCNVIGTRDGGTDRQKVKKMSIKEVDRFILDEKIEEISGLLIDEQNYWGVNDSGGEPEIYLFRKERPQILKTVRFKGESNNDFEVITENDSLIFVGDVGNNYGNRKDLKFLYFNKKRLNGNKYQEVEVKEIPFFYPEQKDYSSRVYRHNFDLEAAFFDEGKLHLFTKQWGDMKTRHFTLDIISGKQPAWLIEEYDSKFLITDAAVIYKGDKKRMAWVGYDKKGQAYLMITTIDKKDIHFFKGEKSIYSLGFGGDLGQIEGIAFRNWNEVCYSAEAFDFMGAKYEQNVTCLKIEE